MRGFTLIELIVVFAIMGLLTAGGLAAYSSYNSNQLMKNTQAELADLLSLARSRAISQVTPWQCNNQTVSAYQVNVSRAANTYGLQVVCGGTAYTLQAKKLPTDITFNAETLNQFIFTMSTGTVVKTGVISFSGYNQTKRITVQSTGTILIEK